MSPFSSLHQFAARWFPGRRHRHSPNRHYGVKPCVEVLEDRTLLSISIQFNYYFDDPKNGGIGFFTKYPQAKQALQLAAGVYESRLSTPTPLAEIQPNPAAGDTWTIQPFSSLTDPPGPKDTATNAPDKFESWNNLFVPENTLIIFVRGSNQFGTDSSGQPFLADGGPGRGYELPGTASAGFVNDIYTRGQPAFSGWGTVWGGAIDFNVGTSWYPGTSSSVPGNQEDLYSSALHEIGHVLGIGTAGKPGTAGNMYKGTGPWFGKVNYNYNTFVGTNSESVYGSEFGSTPVPVPLDSGPNAVEKDSPDGHWAKYVSSPNGAGGVEQALLATTGFSDGKRYYVTPLDWAGFQDLGWQVLPAGTVSVHGKLVNLNNGGLGLPNVKIYTNFPDGESFAARTDQNGSYSGTISSYYLSYFMGDNSRYINASATSGGTVYLVPSLADLNNYASNNVQVDFSTEQSLSFTNSPPPFVPDPQPDGTLSIFGPSGNDQFYISRQGVYLNVTVNGKTTAYPYSGVTYLNIEGSGGTDSLTVDNSGGTAVPVGGISFDAGAAGGNNQLVVKGGFSKGQYVDEGHESGTLIFGSYCIGFGGVAVLQAPMPIFNNLNGIVQAAPWTILIGQAFSLDLSAKDADGDGLSYSFTTNGPGGLGWTENPTTGRYTFTPSAGQEGTYTVTATAYGNGSSFDTATVTFEITVLSGPTIGSLSYALSGTDIGSTGITVGDSNPVTFTASNVTTPYGTLDGVFFQYEVNNDGVLHSLPGAGQVSGTNNWVLPTPLVIGSTGTVVIYATASSGGGPGPFPAIDLASRAVTVSRVAGHPGRKSGAGRFQPGPTLRLGRLRREWEPLPGLYRLVFPGTLSTAFRSIREPDRLRRRFKPRFWRQRFQRDFQCLGRGVSSRWRVCGPLGQRHHSDGQ